MFCYDNHYKSKAYCIKAAKKIMKEHYSIKKIRIVENPYPFCPENLRKIIYEGNPLEEEV